MKEKGVAVKCIRRFYSEPYAHSTLYAIKIMQKNFNISHIVELCFDKTPLWVWIIWITALKRLSGPYISKGHIKCIFISSVSQNPI